MTDTKPKSYTGSDITVAFDGNRCLHFAECLRGLPAVFDVRTRPWITPDNADADAVAEVVETPHLT
ncbi:(4Fe-4S)-binding protein [Kibdelosporangium lantanae]|uniref:(4Fe-4S)-binding protein n=1 Tax=Kibdelosporangium lantanae TaxID=1497396 RepID=A0ABW3MDA2_9PSEU